MIEWMKLIIQSLSLLILAIYQIVLLNSMDKGG